MHSRSLGCCLCLCLCLCPIPRHYWNETVRIGGSLDLRTSGSAVLRFFGWVMELSAVPVAPLSLQLLIILWELLRQIHSLNLCTFRFRPPFNIHNHVPSFPPPPEHSQFAYPKGEFWPFSDDILIPFWGFTKFCKVLELITIYMLNNSFISNITKNISSLRKINL